MHSALLLCRVLPSLPRKRAQRAGKAGVLTLSLPYRYFWLKRKSNSCSSLQLYHTVLCGLVQGQLTHTLTTGNEGWTLVRQVKNCMAWVLQGYLYLPRGCGSSPMWWEHILSSLGASFHILILYLLVYWLYWTFPWVSQYNWKGNLVLETTYS